MNVFAAILAILNIVTIIGPVAGVAVVYQSNLQEMVIPPQLQSIVNGGVGGGGGASDLFSGASLQPPQFVNAVADTAARSVTIYLNFTNPFNYDLDLNSVSADIVCQEHNFTLGHASLLQPTVLAGNQTSDLAMVCQWTIDAENHFLTAHAGAQGVDVNVIGLTIDVNGITVRSNEPYAIPDLPITTQITPPTYISSVTNLADKSVTLTFSFTNPFSYDLYLTSVSADVACTAHGFTLGHATLVNPVTIPASASINFQMVCDWTQTAENHLATLHPGITSIDVDVVGLTVVVNDITVQAPGSYHVPNVPLT